MAHYEDAIGYFEQQLATLERLNTPTAQLDRGRAFGSLGDCYDALGDPEEAVKCHEQYLTIASKLKSGRDQERLVCIHHKSKRTYPKIPELKFSFFTNKTDGIVNISFLITEQYRLLL